MFSMAWWKNVRLGPQPQVWRPSRKSQSRTFRPRLDVLEDRLLLSTFVVTTGEDSGPGSLRQAILDSNAEAGANTIEFNIDTGAQTIALASPLPTVTVPVILDGATQPEFAGAPLIELDGSNAGASAHGLRITAGNSTVRALVIDRFGGNGILLEVNGNNVIEGNYLGTDLTGTIAQGNGLGIDVKSASNIIGGTTAGSDNVISGNRVDGMRIEAPNATGNLVQGNFVGTDASGANALGNTLNGVVITASGNTVGGIASGARNILSGNGQQGVYLNGATATGNLVVGNYIGTDVNGGSALSNGLNGVLITGAGNTIGGTLAEARNVISGNRQQGIFVNGAGATQNLIAGNYIGTDAGGASAVSNGLRGITVAGGASGNTIGGTDAGAGNLLSGNLQNGLELTGAGTTSNLVQGNLIGTDAAGAAPLPNHFRGIGISYGAFSNTVGGTAAGARNIISGNIQNGVLLDAGTDANVVQGNYIGTDVTGTQAVPNGAEGILLGKTSVAGPITHNLIGGIDAGAGNLISGNTREGIRIVEDQTSENVVQGNYLGTDVTGTLALANGTQGLLIQRGANHNLIGGTDPGAGNLISGNQQNGVLITDAGTSGNIVEGNFIGTDITDTLIVANGIDGVSLVSGASANAIGDATTGAANVISGNARHGVSLTGAGTTDNLVQGNYIGTDLAGAINLGNGADGVHITAASRNTIGAAALAAAGNSIAFNGNDGVLVDAGTGDAIRGNAIFSNARLGIELINGGNRRQASPLLTSAYAGAGSVTINGTLTNTPDTPFLPATTYTLEFFANTDCGPGGVSQGQRFLGSITVTTDTDGNASFTATFTADVAAGEFVTVTATDPDGDTSAFSQCVAVQ